MIGDIKNAYLPLVRKHVLKGAEWGHSIASDYWLSFNPGFDILAGASTATGDELAENGWTATSLVNTAGTGSDFAGGVLTSVGSSAPAADKLFTPSDMGVPNHVLTNATGDLLASPAIFGDFDHMLAVMRLLGKSSLPRYLIAEFTASFTVASADETQSAIGFFEDNGTVSVEADQYAVVRSNGTNFLGQGNAATGLTLALISTTWHVWRIVLDYGLGAAGTGPNITYYIDGVKQNATPQVGIQDEFPLKFGLHALTTNRPGMGTLHIWYDY